MFGVGLLFLFLVGLPISFVIGGVIGYIVWLFNNKTREIINRKKCVIVGGISYILSQPVSFVLVGILPIRKMDTILGYSIPLEGLSLCEMLFAILFAFFVTLILVQVSNKKLF